eukprot:Gb_13203 [translate_table: standard]
MEFDGIFIRLALSADAPVVETTFAASSRYEFLHFKQIIETSLYSFVALSADNEVLGFSSFNDVPTVVPGISSQKAEEAKSWAWQEALNLGFLVDSLLWIEVCMALDHNEEHTLLRNFCFALFHLSPFFQSILHLKPPPSIIVALILLFGRKRAKLREGTLPQPSLEMVWGRKACWQSSHPCWGLYYSSRTALGMLLTLLRGYSISGTRDRAPMLISSIRGQDPSMQGGFAQGTTNLNVLSNKQLPRFMRELK